MSQRIFNTLLFLILFVSLLSISFLLILSIPASMERFKTPTYYFFHQLFFGFIPGFFLCFVAYKINLEWLRKWSFVLILINILSLFLVFIPFLGITAGGATRWLNFKFFSVQPAEFLKITTIIYLASWCSSHISKYNNSDWKYRLKKGSSFLHLLVPFAIFLGLISLGLYLQKDASTLFIILFTLTIIYFCARAPLWHILFLFLLGVLFFFYLVKFEPYRWSRFLVFLNPYLDPLGKGYQLRQSLISIGSGGIFGKGLGMSSQKFDFLPQAMTDSIFAIIGEEFGLLGTAGLVIFFIFLFWLGYKIAKATHDMFRKLLAIGIVFYITLQAFINILSSIGFFPLTGVPLPFFSYGGSHLIVEFFSIGLLLNIAKKL